MVDAPGPVPGALVGGRWRLLREAGSGGEASVWWAESLLGEDAPAVLKLRTRSDAETRARFLREWAIASALRHPRLVRAHDHGDDPAYGLWVVFEALGETAWAEVQARGPMTEASARDAVVQMLEGLEVLHGAGVVHRDLKPHNLLRDPDSGGWKLADFGIARVDGDASVTDTATTMGTWAWSAPEQRHSARSVSQAADIYAVGATLYSLISGRVPFELHATGAGAPAFDGVPEALARVILRATRLDPLDRYGSASEMREAVAPAEALVPRRSSGVPVGGMVMLVLALASAWVISRDAVPHATKVRTRAPEVHETLGEVPVAATGYGRARLLWDDPDVGAEAGSALAAWHDPEDVADARLAIGAPGAAPGGKVGWVPHRRAIRTRNVAQDFGATLAVLLPMPENEQAFLMVGGPAQNGHIFYFDPLQRSPGGWVFSDTEELGVSGSGASLADLGDVYGVDRVAVAYGAPAAGDDGRGVARVHLLAPGVPDVARFWGDTPDAALGSSMVALDADGDGLRELYLGAPGGEVGSVWKVGPYVRGYLPVSDVAEGVVRGFGQGDRFGAALAAAGDTDGDGYPELWVGAPGAEGARGRTGVVALLPASWTGEMRVETLARAVLHGAESGGGFGAVLAGDGRGQGVPVGVAVSAPGEGNGVVRVYDPELFGDVYPAEARATWCGAVPGGRFGAAMLLDVDLDGDGFEDLVVGAPGERNGRVWAFEGG